MSLWRKLKLKAFRCATLDSMLAKASTQTKLRRVLGLTDLVLYGMASVIGSGVFVLTGEVAREHAGPAVILSYGLAAVAALFTALSYAEFAADVPVSGAAYSYIDLVFGEFISWMSASSLLMDYIFSTCTVAKGVSGYLSTLIGIDSDALVMTVHSTDEIVIDFVGAGMIVFLTALLAYGARESFNFNGLATTLSVVAILFTICAAVPNIEISNYTPFFPEELGTARAIRGASIVFFSYIGFDALATMAEESKNPSRDMPISILLSLGMCTVLYVLMAVVLVGMIPYNKIDVMAAYSTGFQEIGWDWASRVVSFGALLGIITSLFGAICGQSRLIMVLGREGFLPRHLAKIHERTKTPINATVWGGIGCAVLTLLLDISTLASLVSMGTLFVFCLVCLASIWRRYCKAQGSPTDAPSVSRPWIAIRVTFLLLVSMFEGLAVDREWPLWIWACTMVCFAAVVVSFFGLPVVYKSATFALPFQPVESCLGVLCCVHLIVTLGTTAYIRFIAWQGIAIIIYVLYGVHHTSENQESFMPLMVESPI